MNKQRIVSNLMIIGSGQVATWVMSMGYVVIVSNYLGPTHLGALLLAQSIVGVLALAQPPAEVLFGRKRPRAANFINGTVTGTVVQLDSVVGTINLGSAPSPAPRTVLPTAPALAWSRNGAICASAYCRHA